MASLCGRAFRTVLFSPDKMSRSRQNPLSFVVSTYRIPPLPLTQQGPALRPPARLHLHSACAINTHLHHSLGSHAISTQPVHDRPHLRESKPSVPLWFAVAIRPHSRKAIYKRRPNLPWNGGWSAGRTLRPRGNPRPCRWRTTASRVPSYHPCAKNADAVSHTFTKSLLCSPCSSSSVSPGLGPTMKGVSREIKSARGLYSLYERCQNQDYLIGGTHKQIDRFRFGQGRDGWALRGLWLRVRPDRTI